MARGATNAEAVGRLYEETGFLVQRRCLRMLRDPEEAADVTHWTYLRALELNFEVRSRGEALAWLYLTATRRCLSLLRDGGNRRRLALLHEESLAPPGEGSPEAAAVTRDLFVRALRAVDDYTGEIAMLTYLQEMSVERAGELTETSVRTVARARARFQAELAQLMEGAA
jgi:RNA polymerase sigma-70 factor (ECF subfamily)